MACACCFLRSRRGAKMAQQGRCRSGWSLHEMDGFQGSAMFSQDFFDHFCSIAQDMEAICRMPRFWCTFPGSTGKLPSTVSTDELNSWVSFEPGGERCCLSVFKQVYRRAVLQIHQDGHVFFP